MDDLKQRLRGHSKGHGKFRVGTGFTVGQLPVIRQISAAVCPDTGLPGMSCYQSRLSCAGRPSSGILWVFFVGMAASC